MDEVWAWKWKNKETNKQMDGQTDKELKGSTDEWIKVHVNEWQMRFQECMREQIN